MRLLGEGLLNVNIVASSYTEISDGVSVYQSSAHLSAASPTPALELLNL